MTPTNTTEELPKWEFTGVFIPAELLFLFQDGKLNGNDLITLVMIKGMTKVGGKGCFASNEYLGRSLKKHPKYITQLLRKLKGLGLIRTTKSGRRRFIKATWDAVPPDGDGKGKSCPIGKENLSPNKTKGNKHKTPSPALPARGVSVGAETMGLWEGTVATPTPKHLQARQMGYYTPTAFEASCSEQLRDSLAKALKFRGKWSVRNSARYFRLTLESIENDKGRLMDVLDWYTSNINAKGVPQAYCARTFYEKFPSIEAAMRRIGKAPINAAPITDMTESAKKLADWAASKFNWPKDSASKLPEFCRRCEIGYADLLKRLQSVSRTMEFLEYQRDPKFATLYRFHQKVLGEFSERARDVHLRETIEHTLKQVTGWTDWSGNLNSFVFTYVSKEFRLKLDGLCRAYMGQNAIDHLPKYVKLLEDAK